jgi:hypothetical protein
LPFNLLGWHNDAAGQREELRAALGAAVAVLVAGLGWAVPYQNAIRHGGMAIRGLVLQPGNAPLNAGNLPLLGYYRWLGGLGAGAVPVFMEGVQANFGHQRVNFQNVPQFGFPVNNYWIENPPVLDANGRGNWELLPAPLLQAPQPAVPPNPVNLQPNNTFPVVEPFRDGRRVAFADPIAEVRIIDDFVGDMFSDLRPGRLFNLWTSGILD